MENGDVAIVVGIAGAIASVALSLLKRFAPNLSDPIKMVLLVFISLLCVWGYQLYNVGFDKIMNDPMGTALAMLATTGTAVVVYQLISKPLGISTRIEGVAQKEEEK